MRTWIESCHDKTKDHQTLDTLCAGEDGFLDPTTGEVIKREDIPTTESLMTGKGKKKKSGTTTPKTYKKKKKDAAAAAPTEAGAEAPTEELSAPEGEAAAGAETPEGATTPQKSPKSGAKPGPKRKLIRFAILFMVFTRLSRCLICFSSCSHLYLLISGNRTKMSSFSLTLKACSPLLKPGF